MAKVEDLTLAYSVFENKTKFLTLLFKAIFPGYSNMEKIIAGAALVQSSDAGLDSGHASLAMSVLKINERYYPLITGPRSMNQAGAAEWLTALVAGFGGGSRASITDRSV